MGWSTILNKDKIVIWISSFIASMRLRNAVASFFLTIIKTKAVIHTAYTDKWNSKHTELGLSVKKLAKSLDNISVY